MNLQTAVMTAVVAGWVLPAAACAEGQSPPAPRRQATVPSDSTVVAKVGDQTITLDDVDKTALLADVAAFSGLKLNQALYASRSRVIDELIAERLVQIAADARGVSADEILEQEIRDKVDPVEDADIATWYETNRGRIGARTLEQVREPIRTLMEQQRHQAALDAFVSSMRETVPVHVLLDPPRVEIQLAANDPTFGPEGAPVKIIEFSDFQ